jgi:hypothetical protein
MSFLGLIPIALPIIAALPPLIIIIISIMTILLIAVPARAVINPVLILKRFAHF